MERGLGSPLSSVSTQPSFDPTLRAWWDAHVGHPQRLDSNDNGAVNSGHSHRQQVDRRRKKRGTIWITCSAMALTGVGIAVVIIMGRTMAGLTSSAPTDRNNSTKATQLPTALPMSDQSNQNKILPPNNATSPPRENPGNGSLNGTSTSSPSKVVVAQRPRDSRTSSHVEIVNDEESGGAKPKDDRYLPSRGINRVRVCRPDKLLPTGAFDATKLVRHINLIRETLRLQHVEWSAVESAAVEFWANKANTTCLATTPTESSPRNFFLVDETAQANSTFRYPFKDWYLAGTSSWNYTTHACIGGDDQEWSCHKFVSLLAATAVGCDVLCGCPGDNPHLRQLWCSFDVPAHYNLSTLRVPGQLTPSKPGHAASLRASGLEPSVAPAPDDTIQFPRFGRF